MVAAAEQLGISEAMFYKLRNRVLQVSLEDLEPKPIGRPAQTAERGGSTASGPSGASGGARARAGGADGAAGIGADLAASAQVGAAGHSTKKRIVR